MVDAENAGLHSGRPLVVVSTLQGSLPGESMRTAIAEQSEVYGWDVFYLRFTYGELPEGRDIAGALVEALPPDRISLELRSRGIPTVRIGKRSHPQDSLLPAVLPDLDCAAQMALDHFLAAGLRNIGYIGRDPWASGSPFYEVFRSRCMDSGYECHLVQLPIGPESLAGRYKVRAKVLKDWLPSLPKPIGLLTATDRDAAFVCTVCDQIGISVPDEVALLGVGNLKADCETAPVPLSSIDWGRREQARRACSLLKHLMDGGPLPLEPVLVEPAGVVARRSTAVSCS